jgi:hypothetical protein
MTSGFVGCWAVTRRSPLAAFAVETPKVLATFNDFVSVRRAFWLPFSCFNRFTGPSAA